VTAFREHGDHLAIDLDGATALFTTRHGGISEGPYASLNLGRRTGDDGARVEANRERLGEVAGHDWGRFARAIQVHGTRVRRVEAVPRREDPWEEADGHVTELAGVPALVFVADCLPIALAGDGGVAMVHAGWRGLAGGIVAEAAAALGGGPLRAAIGPGIGPCCYEVGDEVRAAFGTSGPTVDLKAIARERLTAAGVETVHDCGLCTIHDPERFFSPRRDRGVTGRQAGVAWRS
jgi:hypothetical protein